MTTIVAQQVSNSTVELNWTIDVAQPLTFEIFRELNPPSSAKLSLAVEGANRSGLDSSLVNDGILVGDVLEYELVDPAGPTTLATSEQITVVDLDVPFTYGPVNALATAPRYTTLDAVKLRLGIDGATFDDRVTQAIVAAEYAIDAVLHRSFPDTGTNPQWSGVPLAVTQAASNASVATYKANDAPFGIAGADDFLGTIDAFEIVRREVRHAPNLLGFRVGFGTG